MRGNLIEVEKDGEITYKYQKGGDYKREEIEDKIYDAKSDLKSDPPKIINAKEKVSYMKKIILNYYEIVNMLLNAKLATEDEKDILKKYLDYHLSIYQLSEELMNYYRKTTKDKEIIKKLEALFELFKKLKNSNEKVKDEIDSYFENEGGLDELSVEIKSLKEELKDCNILIKKNEEKIIELIKKKTDINEKIEILERKLKNKN